MKIIFLLCLAGAAHAATDSALLKHAVPNGEPVALVRAFIDADANGMQTDSDYWPLVQKFAVWQDGPGWDTVTAVTSAEIVASEVKTATATVTVKYGVFGALNEDGENAPVLAVASATQKTVVYRLAKKRGKWKIVAPQDGPLVSIPWLLEKRYADYCRAHDCSADAVIKALRAENAAHPFREPR